MTYRRDRERRPEELVREPREEPAEPPAAEQVLALQRSAGNQAVTTLLARTPDTKPAEKDKEKAAGQATLPGIGTIALLSVSFGTPSRPGRGGGEDAPREIVLSSRVGEHSAKLMRASLDGKPMAVEITMPGGVTLKLKAALVSNYSTSSGGGEEIESWTLNFESIEREPGAAEAEPGD